MAAILNSAILNLAILQSAISSFSSQTHSHLQDWFPPFEQKKPSFIHPHWTWWWQPSWILPTWFQTFCTKNFTHSWWPWTWWWQPSWILSSLIHLLPYVEFRHLVIFSQIHSKALSLTNLTLTQTNSNWLKLIHSHSTWWLAAILNSAILDLDFCHVGIQTSGYHPSGFTQKHSYSTLTLTETILIWLKLIYSHSNLMMAVILNSDILISTILDSAILVFSLKLTHTCQDWFQPFAQKINFTHTSLLTICTKKLHSFIPTQLDDGGHLDFCHLEFCPSLIHLLHCGIQTSFFSSLRFIQNQSPSTLTLTQTNSIWLKLIHSHSTWWWQPSWILPSWI